MLRAKCTEAFVTLATLATVTLATLATGCADDGDPAATSDGPPATEVLSEPGDGAELKADGFGAPTTPAPGAVFRLSIEHGAFPADTARGLPNVVAYVPARFDATQPFGVVVFLHGFWNCAENVIRPKNGSCVPRGAIHNAYNLANQLEGSNRNAILVVPELAFEQASSAPGALENQDTFYAMVDEVMTQLADTTGGLTLWDAATIVVASHSGGYHAASGIITNGGLWVDELYLLDSLYGDDERFDAFVADNADLMAETPPVRRFATVYSQTGGTLAAAQAMAGRAKATLADHAVDAATLLDDRTTATLTTAQYGHGALFKRTGLGHDDIPRYYFGRLLATSTLPAIAAPTPSN